MCLIHCRTNNYGLDSLSYHGAQLRNFLPNDLKECKIRLDIFKVSVSNWNMNRCIHFECVCNNCFRRVCVRVCTYVHANVTRTCVRVHGLTRVNTLVPACEGACMCVCERLHMRMNVSALACVSACVCACMCVRVRLHMRARLCVRLRLCVYACGRPCVCGCGLAYARACERAYDRVSVRACLRPYGRACLRACKIANNYTLRTPRHRLTNITTFVE